MGSILFSGAAERLKNATGKAAVPPDVIALGVPPHTLSPNDSSPEDIVITPSDDDIEPSRSLQRVGARYNASDEPDQEFHDEVVKTHAGRDAKTRKQQNYALEKIPLSFTELRGQGWSRRTT